MSFDKAELARTIARHGRVARIVVAKVEGSTPREVGAAMLVWRDGDGIAQSGTIGGGTLEFEAAKAAFSAPRLTRHALGPALGQCCGGAVTLLTERFDTVEDLPDDVFARGPSPEPLGVRAALRERRRSGQVTAQLVGQWMVEPVAPARAPLWIWGAGHVGRALVHTLAPLPHFSITWIDTAPERFPHTPPQGVTLLPVPQPQNAMALAPAGAAHLIVTYSHALDLELCHQALAHGFMSCGVIGSATKWARFRSRLAALGHSDASISRICCPIGQPALGKHPQAIAVGVAAQLLLDQEVKDSRTKTQEQR
ncbi:xanthine dehydrogenase accessory protein XdhC [Aquimixticola soesokkakensis]|uniref:xanthine dehydrogenase accessory protein XdhC n=1 Tax=Aquimixticola soesokkakensis TaxID=1519096 RepID=UPI000A26CE9C|nr:xanthine dehydrogenase accessory protein XdhC [Aquimixticola soesokkakensis]